MPVSGAAEAVSRSGADGADVVQGGGAEGAVGEAGAAVAIVASEGDEMRLAGAGLDGHAAVLVAPRAARQGVLGERVDVGGKRVELGGQAGFRRAETVLCRSEIGIGEEAGAAESAADVVLEVLDLVEVGGPVNVAVCRAAASLQGGGVAQALAAPGEIPDAPVVPAVEVAGGAAGVALRAHARVGGVVEDALARQHLGRQRLLRDGGDRRRRHRRDAVGE